MRVGSSWQLLRRNPALCVALFIPLLSIAVGATLLTFSLGTQQTMTSEGATTQSDFSLPPLSKTSWREPAQGGLEQEPPAGAAP